MRWREERGREEEGGRKEGGRRKEGGGRREEGGGRIDVVPHHAFSSTEHRIKALHRWSHTSQAMEETRMEERTFGIAVGISIGENALPAQPV
jgi:hypothetical protein